MEHLRSMKNISTLYVDKIDVDEMKYRNWQGIPGKEGDNAQQVKAREDRVAWRDLGSAGP